MSMDMNQMMKQFQQMQAEMERLQAEAAAETVEASAGGGMVTVKANAPARSSRCRSSRRRSIRAIPRCLRT